MQNPKKPLVGISPCYFSRDSHRITFNGRPLLFSEESMCHYIMAQGAQAYTLPTLKKPSERAYRDLLGPLDGLVFAGGVDMSPRSYGEEPISNQWLGDPVRDQYEKELFSCFFKMRKPILGICRGLQLINVALGGSLFQDIETQNQGALCHRDAELYEKNMHGVTLVKGTKLYELYDRETGQINSVHHQAIKDLAPNLEVEAYSSEDQVIEAIRYKDGAGNHSQYCVGVQWHPEFQKEEDHHLLDPQVILTDFMNAIA